MANKDKAPLAAKTLGQMTDDEKAFAETLLDKLPPIIARHQEKKKKKSIKTPHTINNAPLAGTGPDIA